MAEQADMGDTMNFTVRKTFTHYDVTYNFT